MSYDDCIRKMQVPWISYRFTKAQTLKIIVMQFIYCEVILELSYCNCWLFRTRYNEKYPTLDINENLLYGQTEVKMILQNKPIKSVVLSKIN